MRRGLGAASSSSANLDFHGKHAPAKLVKQLKKVRQKRKLTKDEQEALGVAKVLWNYERAEQRQRKQG